MRAWEETQLFWIHARYSLLDARYWPGFIRRFSSDTASSISGEEGPGHDAMADVKFMQVRQRADLGDIDVVDAMPGVDHQLQPVRQRGRAPETFKLGLPLRRMTGLA